MVVNIVSISGQHFYQESGAYVITDIAESGLGVQVQSGVYLASGIYVAGTFSASVSGSPVTISGNILGGDFDTLIDDYTYSGRTYIGKAPAGSAKNESVWQIKVIDETGDYTEIRFSDGVTAFSGVWDNRSGYSY